MAFKSTQNIRKLLANKDIEDSIAFIPKELIDAEINKELQYLAEAAINASANDNTLIPFLADYTAIPIQADLTSIENILSKYKEVNGEFFKESKNDANEPNKISDGFRKASGGDIENNYKNFSGKNTSNNLNNLNKDNTECNVDENILERIKREILESNINIAWDDIVGLEDVKRIINEIILWPMLRPDIFTGLRGPPKGLLLFGPPGTGKTMIGKCIASQCKATFFNISASSLTSKWVGEGEKMVRALFYLARKMSPSVIFIDEIDSILSQRSENENEGSRRIKTEFLVQFDGAGVNDIDRILIIGATNRPQEIDEAARRRLVKRIYVPLPEIANRIQMIKNLISNYKNSITDEGFAFIAEMTDGYSGSDMFNLCREATLEPLREIKDINSFKAEDTRDICVEDFKKAMRQIRKSVSAKDLEAYCEWNACFGSMENK